ncbi:PREP1, partial [Symbiodinium microadriaticum]
AVEDLVLDTLRDLSRRGFDEDAIRASVNSMEFHMREFNTGGFPKGLSVMLGCMSEWIYDRDPLNGIRFEEPLAAVKRDIADGKPVFQEMLEKLFVNNTHRVAVEMIPDESLEEKTIAQEASLLASKKQGMSEEELRDIVKNTAALRTAQSAEDPPEAKATIPRLSLDDIDSTPKEIPEEVHHVLGSQGVLLTHELPSSGILYADIGLDFSKVPLDDLCLLPLFSRMLLESGTRSMDEVALSRKIDAETGGIMASWYSDLKTATGKCTEDKIPVLFELMAEIVLTAKLNNKKRAIEMLLESKARRVESVVSSGHRFGATRLSSYFSFLGYMAEHTSGLSYLRSLDKLIAQAENDWPSVERRLENIRNIIISSSDEEARSSRGEQFVINFTGDKKVLEAGLDHMRIFVDSVRMRSRELPSVSANSEDVVDTWKRTVEVPRRQHSEEVSILADGTSSDTVALPACGGEGFTMNSQVNYVVKGGVMLEPGESVKGSFSVVSRHLSNGYLWDNVRVMGGAYGGFGRFSAQSGRFVFASYRDPNLAETLAIYDGASDALAAEEIDEEEILAGIMGTIGDLDSPLSVDQKGYAAMARYISRESPEDRQMWRNEILRTSSDDFKAFADRLKAVKDKGRVVVFGSKAALEGANSALPEGKKLTVAPAFGNDSI